jgi:hypothetical protein
MNREVRELPYVQSILVLAGIVVLGAAYWPGVKGVPHDLGGELGAVLFAVGAVAVVYEVTARVRVVQLVRRMLEDYTGVTAVRNAGLTGVWQTYQQMQAEAEKPLRAATSIRLLGCDGHKFWARNEGDVRAAVRDGCTFRVLLQDPDSCFARARCQLEGGDLRLAAMKASQAQLLASLARLVASCGRPDCIQVRVSGEPVLCGLVITRGAAFPSWARYSPYLAFAEGGETPTFEISGSDTPLFAALERHFETLWSRADSRNLAAEGSAAATDSARMVSGVTCALSRPPGDSTPAADTGRVVPGS